MLTVAYLTNQFPCAVEPYVGEEIEELRRRGVRVVAGSVRKVNIPDISTRAHTPEIVLQPVSFVLLVRAARLLLHGWPRISDIIRRVIWLGHEGPVRRLKALAHTLLGACYAVLLEDREDERISVDHIHVHHGYFGSWIGMVAARLLDIPFSMTLHGSDLLLNAAYIDLKLESCSCCFTVSEYNRGYILKHYPGIEEAKVLVSRLGVEVSEPTDRSVGASDSASALNLLSVGRLHPVKDHAFLLRACNQLNESGVEFTCSIAGEGPERCRLESLIRKYDLEHCVTLLGHVSPEQMDSLYSRADLVVMTSRSEGIPLALMEAMARGKIVLAPAITGIPELVTAGKTGFLYAPGSLDDFVARLLFIRSFLQASYLSQPHFLSAASQLDWIRHAARVQVRHKFNRKKNLQSFADSFLSLLTTVRRSPQPGLPHENSLLQQIQLPVQRNGSLPVRVDGVDAFAGARGGAVFHV
jgi:colanic acid/amylovoran biosynthesis glycosyltransferase